jgi:S-(hydroxymethyl)glutathione dehydrogenase/alcohol dehydrogenase
VLRKIGDTDLEVRDDLELIRGPGRGEVQVRVVATGLCHTDLSIMDGTIPMPMPAILGHEAAGEVVALGDGVTSLAVGDSVIMTWVPPCGRCKVCLGGQPNLCGNVANPFMVVPTHRTGDGIEIYPLATIGSFVEEVVLHQESLVPIPKDVSPAVASIIGCAVMTGVGAAMNAAKVEPGASVVVFGCGGVGMSVIQGARLCGAAEIAAVDPVPERLEAARALGATHTYTPDRIGDADEIHGSDGFDYAFEVVGRPETIRSAYNAARRGGKVIVVGAGGMDKMVEFSAFELFYTEKTIIGTVYGSGDVRRDFHRLLRLWRTGRLDLESLVTRTLPMSEINAGLAALRRGEGIRQVVEFG